MEKIIGVGNALVDVLARIEGENILAELSLPKGGMTLIDEEFQKRLSGRMRTMDTSMAVGGSACNAMLVLANLGDRPGFLGKVGRDAMGDFFETENEYMVLVYYRGQGARYDRLVGMSKVKTS